MIKINNQTFMNNWLLYEKKKMQGISCDSSDVTFLT